jgi:hypothetical protein
MVDNRKSVLERSALTSLLQDYIDYGMSPAEYDDEDDEEEKC